jgi:DNA-binding PadR family transcriptional regulator
LLARDDSAAYQNELKPEPSKPDRDALQRAGLITSTPKGRNRRIWIEVTEKGWAWAKEHLDHPLPQASPAGSAILQGWLTRLKLYMNANDVPLAEILVSREHLRHSGVAENAPSLPPNAPQLGGDYQQLRESVRQVYLALTDNRLNARARLSELREKLRHIDRAQLDGALRTMQREEDARLYPLDNKAEVTEADREAAIYFGDEPRHILWLSR